MLQGWQFPYYVADAAADAKDSLFQTEICAASRCCAGSLDGAGIQPGWCLRAVQPFFLCEEFGSDTRAFSRCNFLTVPCIAAIEPDIIMEALLAVRCAQSPQGGVTDCKHWLDTCEQFFRMNALSSHITTFGVE